MGRGAPFGAVGNTNLGQSVCRLLIDAVDSFTYAAWQNSVPVLRSISIDNTGSPELSNLKLMLHASVPFIRDRTWVIDRIGAGEKLSIPLADLSIDPEYLNHLEEAERAILAFRLVHRETVIQEREQPIRVLARDEWGGLGSMGELLPAFVTPNDPALAVLLRSAATLLGQHGHTNALDGYLSGSSDRVYMLAASLWSAIASYRLIYAVPPASFEQTGQKTRRIKTILNDRLATCLDSSLLFASGLEAMGLNPVLVLIQGHCFVGVWLVKKMFARLVERDCVEIRKAIAAKELIVFETTLVTHHPPARFPDAISTANSALSEGKEREFAAVVDIARGRMSQIRPLASHEAGQDHDSDDSEAWLPPLPNSPEIEQKRVPLPSEQPQTPAGRIDRWQRRLLDLSLRNRLLNFRPSKQTVPMLCPDVSRLEDRLANGTRMRLVSLKNANPIGSRDAELHLRRTQRDLEIEFAKESLDRDEIACLAEERDLDARLTSLYRKVRADLAEGGANTLYLAVGFLRWKQAPTDTTSYRAPLLLVPVTLSRRSAASPFYLSKHEDEAQFNSTLVQMLKKDFDCNLNAFDNEVPTDDSGVDVPLIFELVRQAVRDIPGFEVVEEAAIGPFSFAKFLMWKDLVDRVGQLEQNRVVRHLIHDPDKAFRSGTSSPIPQPSEIDRRYTPQQIVHPLPADSSQLAAVMAASEGHDLVIVGPPGTGKSQTIANIIAQCLAVGKTVLFVAEKTAALDVVHRRLQEHGLGDCCVELHSNKAERRRFLDQLQDSWKNRNQIDPARWDIVNENLKFRRDELNAYVEAIHTPATNGWTVFLAMGECVRDRERNAPRLVWPATESHDRSKYLEMRSTVEDLASAWMALPANVPPLPVMASEWSLGWETLLLDSCRVLEAASESLTKAKQSLSRLLGIPDLAQVTMSQLSKLFRLAQELARPATISTELLNCSNLAELRTALDEQGELLQRHQQAELAMDSALQEMGSVLGASLTSPLQESQRRLLYRVANEVTSGELPPDGFVFHPNFEQISELLNVRPQLLLNRQRCFAALEARSFNPVLIECIPIEAIEASWSSATNSIWPLSIWRMQSTAKTLQAYMSPQGVATPEVDVPLLVQYRSACVQLNENAQRMSLPQELQAKVDIDSNSVQSPLLAAKRLREAILATGANLPDMGRRNSESLKPLKVAVRKLIAAGREVENQSKNLKGNLSNLRLSPELQSRIEQDPSSLDTVISHARSIQDGIASLEIASEMKSQVMSAIPDVPEQQRQQVAADFCRGVRGFQTAWTEFSRIAETSPAENESTSIVISAAETAREILQNRTILKQWIGWQAIQSKARSLGLAPFVDSIKSSEFPTSEAVSRFELSYARWWLPTVVDHKQSIRQFQRHLHEDAIRQFQAWDQQAREAAESRVRWGVQHNLPESDQVPRKSELGLLRHQMGLKRPSKSIRELIAGMPETFAKLAPCLLMSPLSIAQYLPASQSLFDVVIFDEASQIATWDAIGAIARGKQTIIVGDPKQLPPTNFFGKVESDDDNEELSDHEKDMESILDEAQASGLPTLQLNWHYRSRHESLIAFSNWNYYGNELVTFPAAESEDRGVSLRHVKGALYDRGKSRTNRLEADAIVGDLVDRMKRDFVRSPEQRLTYGVVTFNSQQQELIQDLLDDALRKNPELEWYFADDRVEPTIVKNLENVQGDERDVMMFSIAFGPDAAGKFPVDFGAINRDGGERRLNVAITRARRELVVFASFLPDQLRAERSQARGVRDLKAFLEYAEKGPEAMVARAEGSLGGFESPLEEAVAASLASLGWQVETQIGVSGFRIDLGIVHPDKPGAYLAGVECDGMTYHRSAMARDRDKTRQQVLENLGWRIARVWSTDWWYDPDGAIRRLHETLNTFLDASRQQAESLEPDPLEPATSSSLAVADARSDAMESDSEPEARPHYVKDPTMESFAPPQLIAGQVKPAERAYYNRALLGDASANQDRFFDDDYSEELKAMAVAVLKEQSPIRDDVLARDVARAHGFNRTGNRIKERVLALLPYITKTVEPEGTFLWNGPSSQPSIPFRFSTSDEERRSLDEIAMPELIGLVLGFPELEASDDPALELAREIGLLRLSRASRERLEAAIDASRSST